MAIDDAYADVLTYRIDTGKTDDADDVAILRDLKAVSRLIESLLGQYFTKDAANVTRAIPVTSDMLVSYGRELVLKVPLAATPASIKIADAYGAFSGAALLSTDYELHPLDALYGPTVNPYSSIFLTPTSTHSWIVGRQIQIVGKFGWPSVPPGIEKATIELTRILRLESPRATNRIAEGFDGVIEASPQAQNIIKQLMNTYKVHWFA